MCGKQAQIVSVGTAVPQKVMTNSDFEKFVDTSDEWIVQRTGIKTRYISDEDVEDPTAVLGTKAAQKALEKAGLQASDLDCIICATFTPDYFFPSTACNISNRIGCPAVFAFDLYAACSGFLYGLNVANSLIASGQ